MGLQGADVCNGRQEQEGHHVEEMNKGKVDIGCGSIEILGVNFLIVRSA